MFDESGTALDDLRGSSVYKTDRDEPYYSINFTELHTPAKQLHTIDFEGYRDLGGGLYEAWSYVADDVWRIDDGTTGEYEYFEYTPDEDDVEGEDYIVMPVRDIDLSESSWMGFVWTPAKIFFAVKSIVRVEDGEVRLCSFEETESGNMPGDLSGDGGLYGVEMHHSTMYVDKDSFPENVMVHENSPSGGGIHDDAEMALKYEKDVLSVHKYRATDGELEYDPATPVTVEISLIFNADTNVEMYRIYEAEYEEDGTVRTRTECELMDITVDEERGTVTATVSDFHSIYAVTGKRAEMITPGADEELYRGDANGDGKVNLLDCSLILQYIAAWDVAVTPAADANEDGRANLMDVATIIRFLPGMMY